MAKHNLLGQQGENIACDYLRQKGYEILEQNYRRERVELDIIAKYNDTLIFVEVKTRSTDFLYTPLDALTPKKQAAIQKAAIAYMREVKYEWAVRFDFIGIVLLKSDQFKIQHIEGVFFN